MKPPSDPFLRHLLHELESDGDPAGVGEFTLNPERAVAILRAQGRLSQSGPLPLLAALYAHTQGGPIGLDRAGWKLSWPADRGPLLDSVERLLGEASLEAQGIRLRFHRDHVRLRALKGPEVIERVFASFWSRLMFYPWQTPLGPGREPLLRLAEGEFAVDIYPAPALDPFGMIARPSGRFVQVLQGISYPRKWALPVDAVLQDPESRPDLSMTVVPQSERRLELEAQAARLFRQSLQELADPAPVWVLDAGKEGTEDLPLFVQFCAYALSQECSPELARLVGEKVLVRDATQHLWTLDDLWRDDNSQGHLLVIEAQGDPMTLPERPERPVIRWAGQVRQVLLPLFTQLAPGGGYLYTLSVNEAERARLSLGQSERRLASRSRQGQTWSLLPWGDPDRTAEIEFVGPRRARETFYLDPLAPRGMRLLWESPSPLDRASRELVLDGPTRRLILTLIGDSLPHQPLPREAILSALQWACQLQPLDPTGLEAIENAPLLELVDGGFSSLQRCRQKAAEGEELPVLRDRSTSIPAKLPLPEVLWDHPILATLGFPTREVSRQFRESHWQELGRARWLAAHSPQEPNWPAPPWVEIDGHRIARAGDPTSSTQLAFWRQGRPFGSITLDPEACRPGFQVLWVEDELPADAYWSGPQLAAILERIPQADELCRRATEAYPEGL